MANAFTPAQPCSKVYLTIKANKLRDMDTFSKSDPLCVVYQFVKHPDRNGEWIELGRTEIVWNCLNPEFATKILCDYLFEERQKVKFELYDADSMSSDLSKHDFLGYCDCYLAEIVSARTYTKNLGGLRGTCGSITVSAEELDEGSKEQAEFHVRATKLDRKDIFGSSDPFLKIYRIMDNGSRQLAHQTTHLTRTLNPEWAVFRVNLQILCGGDRTRPFMIECWDYEYDGSHQLIGSCEISVQEILTRTKTSIPLLNHDLFCRSLCCMAYQNSGILHFMHFQIVKQYTFLDYIQAGTQLDFTVAVDLTASSGDPRKPSSLHYISSKAPSQYEVAIRAVVEICQYYNKTKHFNAFGFGAITPGNRKASEIFNLNLSSTCEVFGLQGVLEAYHHCIPMVQLYGPTNFAPVVRNAGRTASETLDGSRYQILLIITDGAISDMAETKRAIISASFLPLSIIIVGVGDEEFDSMDELDSDDSLLAFEGRQAQRDIVQVRILQLLRKIKQYLFWIFPLIQFVPLRQFLRGPVTGMEGERVMELLAKEVLAEVPLQLTSYMELNRIAPKQQNGKVYFLSFFRGVAMKNITDSSSELEMSFTSSPINSARTHPYPTAPPVA
ncbi:hypothetical protein Y032_0002g1004 [Ancylostoma ceylanicum]|uniref:Uncharacterized protein n=1 Tax=Ancylostoma ceylanicum TaxID=53326 RepID=A0A016VZ08_9BILA|nr:hypothetical protein Y032_0002g1004 [Ancylostoma ceylanicum]